MKRYIKPPIPSFKSEITNILFDDDFISKKVNRITDDVITTRMLFKKWWYNIKYKVYSCKVKLNSSKYKELYGKKR